MGLRAVPASPTLRQRLDEKAEAFLPWVDEANLQLLRRAKVDITSLPCGWTPLDMDVFTLDNSQTQKEGIGWTYAGYMGYAPIAAYLGREGWNIGMELREGTQHSAEETDATLDRVLPRAMVLTPSPLLVRMDAGFHGKTIAQTLARHDQERQAAGGAPIAFLIKWNRRGQNLSARIAQRLADPTAAWECPRSGKRITIWEEIAQLGEVAVRRVLRLTERSSLANGQVLLLPETTLEGWDTTLPAEISSQAVIALYADHATHEQFHAEIKTDLDLERLPSGKFATNDLILTLGGIYNLLRMIGQATAGTRCSAAPSGQAPSRQDGDPGSHHSGGPSRPSCSPVDLLLPTAQLSRLPGLSAPLCRLVGSLTASPRLAATGSGPFPPGNREDFARRAFVRKNCP